MLERIGKYEIKRQLGKGATGTVYLAADPFRQTDVAIKVMEKLPAEADAARRQLRFFQNEAALAGKLRHPHIVSIFDAGIEELTGGDALRYLICDVRKIDLDAGTVHDDKICHQQKFFPLAPDRDIAP